MGADLESSPVTSLSRYMFSLSPTGHRRKETSCYGRFTAWSLLPPENGMFQEREEDVELRRKGRTDDDLVCIHCAAAVTYCIRTWLPSHKRIFSYDNRDNIKIGKDILIEQAIWNLCGLAIRNLFIFPPPPLQCNFFSWGRSLELCLTQDPPFF